jgi:hypothetical protein
MLVFKRFCMAIHCPSPLRTARTYRAPDLIPEFYMQIACAEHGREFCDQFLK